RMLAMSRLVELIKLRRKPNSLFRLNMEPFEVLSSMIRDAISPHVSGSPQVIKMYPSCTSQVIGVRWPLDDPHRVAVAGRPILDYEELDCPVLDPDTLECSVAIWRRRQKLLSEAREGRPRNASEKI